MCLNFSRIELGGREGPCCSVFPASTSRHSALPATSPLGSHCPASVWFWWGCQPQKPHVPLAWPIMAPFPPGHSRFPRRRHMTCPGPITVILQGFLYGCRETDTLLSPFMLLTSCRLSVHRALSPHTSLREKSLGKGDNPVNTERSRREMERVLLIVFQALKSLKTVVALNFS